ncbi:MAG: hypothetical protein ACI8TX_002733, partial [Hyphomicrobiaceae bacterium]
CAAEPANEGNVCDDGDFCTDGDTCTSGTCSGTLRDNCLVCGNDVVEPGEDCDDGDTEFLPGEACDVDCTAVSCAQPTNTGSVRPKASDALFVLKAAVSLETCVLTVCDVNGDGRISAGDALAALKAAVGFDVSLECPEIL